MTELKRRGKKPVEPTSSDNDKARPYGEASGQQARPPSMEQRNDNAPSVSGGGEPQSEPKCARCGGKGIVLNPVSWLDDRLCPDCNTSTTKGDR